jgi:glycosyltransferase involved in cell wall biosynthesis
MRERIHYLSIIIPVYNEEESVPILHERLSQVMQGQSFAYEIIYVDDGSRDGTFAQLRSLALQDQRVKAVRLRRNFGQTAALAAGVDFSSGELLIFMDGDLQNDPIDIPRLLAQMNEGYDVVSGWRKHRQDGQFDRKLPSLLANRLISWVTGVHLHDYGCTLKCYRWEVFQHLRLYGDMHRFLPAYAALAGARVAELEVAHHARRFGVSKYGISRTVRVLLDLVTVKFLGSYGTRPMYAFGIPGLAALLLGLAGSVVALSRRGRDWPASGSLSALLHGAHFGIQSIMLGLLAEMLMRTYHESQGKTTYTVRESLPQETGALAPQRTSPAGSLALGERAGALGGGNEYTRLAQALED